MLTYCRWLTSSHFSVRCSESTPKLLFVKRTPTLTINDEPGTIRALATCKSTHLCKSFNPTTGVTPETENPDWLPSTSHALPCFYVLTVIGPCRETTLARAWLCLKCRVTNNPSWLQQLHIPSSELPAKCYFT
jgi:hypothetical protein